MVQPLFNPNDGITGRDGGPYLDEVEAVEAEKRRAKVEGREPDLDNPPASAGIALSTAAQMLATVEVNRPSLQHTFHDEAERMFKASAESDNLLTARGSIPTEEVEKAEALVNAKSAEERADDLKLQQDSLFEDAVVKSSRAKK